MLGLHRLPPGSVASDYRLLLASLALGHPLVLPTRRSTGRPGIDVDALGIAVVGRRRSGRVTDTRPSRERPSRGQDACQPEVARWLLEIDRIVTRCEPITAR